MHDRNILNSTVPLLAFVRAPAATAVHNSSCGIIHIRTTSDSGSTYVMIRCLQLTGTYVCAGGGGGGGGGVNQYMTYCFNNSLWYLVIFDISRFDESSASKKKQT